MRPAAEIYKRVAGWAVLLATFHGYVWFRISPSLGYESAPDFPPFALTAAFLKRLAAQPGGPLEAFAALISQLYAVPWLAPVVVSALAACLVMLTAALTRRWSGREAGWAAVVPALVFLALVSRCGHNLCAVSGLLLALCGALLVPRPDDRRTGRRLAVTALVSALVCVLSGGFFVVFAAIMALRDWRLGQRLSGLVWVLAGEAVPYVWGVWVLDQTLDATFSPLLTYAARLDAAEAVLLVALYLAAPVVALWVGRRRPEAEAQGVRRGSSGAVGWALLLAALLVAVGEVSLDRSQHISLRVGRLAQQRDWEALLELARKLPARRSTLGICSHVNRALFETGQMPERMFSYVQVPEGLVLGMVSGPRLSPGQVREMQLMGVFQVADGYLRLGMPNKVEHLMHESLEQWGEHATTLRSLALANLVKGRVDAARVFLNALTHNPVRRNWALETLARIEQDPELRGDATVQALRQAAHTRDAPDTHLSLEDHCVALLEGNPRNPAALQYLMAIYLLNRQPDQVVENLWRVKAAGHSALPRHYQEAVVLHQAQVSEPVELHGYTVEPEILRQFQAFSQAVGPGASEGPSQEVTRQFGNSFFYYYCFGQSGGGE